MWSAAFGGDDKASGGDGTDTVAGNTGRDQLFGGGGDDLLLSNEGTAEVDTVDCGPGEDVAHADSLDIVDVSCESVGTLSSLGCGGATCNVTVSMFEAGGGGAAAIAAGAKKQKQQKKKKKKKKLQPLGQTKYKLKRGAVQMLPSARLAQRGVTLVTRKGTVRVRIEIENRIKVKKGKFKTERNSSFANLSS